MPNLDQTYFTPGTCRKDYWYRLTDGRTGSEPTVLLTSNSQIQDRVTRTSIGTPAYALKRAHKEFIPVNPFSYKRTLDDGTRYIGNFVKVTVGTGYKEYTQYTGIGWAHSIVDAAYHSLEPSVITAMHGMAKNKLLLKIKDQKVNLAQAFAERKQTVDLIASSVTKLLGVYHALRRGNLALASQTLGIAVSKRELKRSRRRSKSLTDANEDWASERLLELQYGWKPLLSDIYGSIDELSRKKPTWNYIRAKAAQKKEEEFKTTVKTSTYTALTELSVSHQIKYGIWFTSDNSLMRSASQIGLSNPALIAWELTPWSFVVDWFIPIGNYISTFDATSGLSFVDGYSTSFVSNKSVFTRTHTGANGETGQYSKKLLRVTVTREKLRSFPSGSLPSFKNPISIDHALNALALLKLTLPRK